MMSTANARCCSEARRRRRFDSKTIAADGEIGMSIMTGEVSFEPHIRMQYARTRQDSFAETGGVGSLGVDSETFKNGRVGIGVRLRQPQSRCVGAALWADRL
jgi:outer membrane autotransporter protein